MNLIFRLTISATILLLVTGCNNNSNTVPEKIKPITVAALAGNYVTADYMKRNQGYDWVAVTVKPLTDSLAHISIRSRADKKQPSCTFDANASLVKEGIMEANVDGRSVLFTFSADSLNISVGGGQDAETLSFFCSGGGSIAGIYTKINGPIDTLQIDKSLFRKSLSYGKFSFEINHSGEELAIQPIGLAIDNRKVVLPVEGTVVNAEIGDLNMDGFPEVLVYIVSDGSGSYGSVIGYSVNKGKSMSQVYLPPVAENPKVNQGYMGHDEFAIVENTFNQRFPIYKPGDSNSKPTGGIRQIQYKLKDGEVSRIFVIDKISEY